jgi:hypothetical protein
LEESTLQYPQGVGKTEACRFKTPQHPRFEGIAKEGFPFRSRSYTGATCFTRETEKVVTECQ